MFISNKTYALMQVTPVVQTVVGLGSALKNLGLLVKDAYLSVFGPEIKKEDKEDFETLNKMRTVGVVTIFDPTVERKDWRKVQDLQSQTPQPEMHIAGVAKGILTAIPIIGTVINWNHLNRVRQIEIEINEFKNRQL